jgi:mannitol-specific phosphotransferase system IIBC component
VPEPAEEKSIAKTEESRYVTFSLGIIHSLIHSFICTLFPIKSKPAPESSDDVEERERQERKERRRQEREKLKKDYEESNRKKQDEVVQAEEKAE